VSSYLENFDDEQKTKLISLPLRTGLWVSLSDESGGDDADEAELLALEGIVTGFAQDFCKSEAAQEIMTQTLSHRDKWEEWEKGLDSVPAECRQCIEWLATVCDYKEVSSFKHTLMEIAMAVAMAYREFDEQNMSLSDKVKMYKDIYAEKLMAFVEKRAPKSLDEILNVSEAEQLALGELSEALQFDKVEGLEPEDIYKEEFEPEKYKIPEDFMAKKKLTYL
jgi:hypothetical protein